MTPDQFALALRLTESGNNPRAYGDNGQALTSYQVHPAWVWDQVWDTQLMPGLADTWDEWVGLLVQAFYKRHSPYASEVEVAMYFHKGHVCHAGGRDWDQNYADRFCRFAGQVGS